METSDGFLAPDLDSPLNSELAKGERLVWVGQPIPWRYARASFVVAAFGAVFTLFAVFLFLAVSWFEPQDFRGMWGLLALLDIPIILVGFLLLMTPYWALRVARRIVYAITDRRAFLIRRGLWEGFTVHSFEPSQLTNLIRTQFADGSGNLVFHRPCSRDGEGGTHASDFGFIAVADVKQVEDEVRKLVERNKSARVE